MFPSKVRVGETRRVSVSCASLPVQPCVHYHTTHVVAGRASLARVINIGELLSESCSISANMFRQNNSPMKGHDLRLVLAARLLFKQDSPGQPSVGGKLPEQLSTEIFLHLELCPLSLATSICRYPCLWKPPKQTTQNISIFPRCTFF